MAEKRLPHRAERLVILSLYCPKKGFVYFSFQCQQVLAGLRYSCKKAAPKVELRPGGVCGSKGDNTDPLFCHGSHPSTKPVEDQGVGGLAQRFKADSNICKETFWESSLVNQLSVAVQWHRGVLPHSDTELGGVLLSQYTFIYKAAGNQWRRLLFLWFIIAVVLYTYTAVRQSYKNSGTVPDPNFTKGP